MSAAASLTDWLARLERQHPVSIDLGLERVAEVACRMGLMDSPIAKRVITVAGTNGKGSTVAMLEALARAHGLSTATYTSPHLLRYNERLRFDGAEAEDDLLVTGFERVETARLAPEPVSLTYFEAGTLGAFWAIAQRRPDLAILEVGLGGRLDAVNVIDPDVAVITTIAQDHAAFLGTDLEQIGREKAGIMRRMRPVVLGSEHLPRSVRQVALSVGAGVHALGDDFRHDEPDADATWTWQGRDGHGNPTTLAQLPDPRLPRDNAASALQALYLAGMTLDVEACRRGFANVQLPGRMQWLGQWCLDVAHNPHAAHYLASRLARRARPARRIGLLGMLGDKDASGVVAALSPQVDGWVAVSLDGERARSASELAALLESQGQTVLHQAQSPAAGAEWLMQVLDEEDEALVCGSFFMVAGVLEWFSLRRVDAAHEPASTARRNA
ncbi:bifunctional tetrahydrofolate synthase/dihydrofolate synthase [Halomonas sp. McH1-25]|uniref:bifunctional tetrahydrofolate synthase/dihydrofolate synthase n=1 Tax=unclassified Halomonas TaxID=2609666 RepID=UPI001EF6CDB5|nr:MULTISPECIES: bifunctional tetrahydrofolate synthase/dihydrofolate synthase [unclassified Halomonas]MCG7599150.1 bifunctional tetrahydrofolate synthase/dihydrofolate synthase [Halomonas sp. McH1-25]MCP1344548.1 bifunctional tetrahydrofolate synthase/dihydrofolate synthase [Halomonas sp. FL8]MCP1361100.1 bifunctional tetrahydrofolate synthase/dihydrofolate synthase [Halomonas sp. BBD45]